MAAKICGLEAFTSARTLVNQYKRVCQCPVLRYGCRSIPAIMTKRISGVRTKSTKLFYSAQANSNGLNNEGSKLDQQNNNKSWTHFGYENVAEHEKKQKVYDVFANVAETYDLMNDFMSGGLHRLWKDYFVRKCNPQPGKKLLDVAGGTGDIAFRYLDGVMANQSGRMIDIDSLSEDIKICDINQSMLDVGKKRAFNKGIHEAVSFMVGDAENLPLEDDSVDLYTIAFGIRNVTHIEKVLDEAYRVLKPGGRFMCLEFSDVSNPILKNIYDAYSFQIIPVIGQIVAQDWKSYQYLVESIRKFPNQETFTAMIEEAGFGNVEHENLTFGVVAIHSGFKI